jgi:hypothetical protein
VIAQLQAAGRESLDLVHPDYRDSDRSQYALNGLCYALCEALYHLCPGLVTPWRILWENGGSHWFVKDQTGAILDLVSHPGPLLCDPEDYAAGWQVPFLTPQPSRRARLLVARAGLAFPAPARTQKGD